MHDWSRYIPVQKKITRFLDTKARTKLAGAACYKVSEVCLGKDESAKPESMAVGTLPMRNSLMAHWQCVEWKRGNLWKDK